MSDRLRDDTSVESDTAAGRKLPPSALDKSLNLPVLTTEGNIIGRVVEVRPGREGTTRFLKVGLSSGGSKNIPSTRVVGFSREIVIICSDEEWALAKVVMAGEAGEAAPAPQAEPVVEPEAEPEPGPEPPVDIGQQEELRLPTVPGGVEAPPQADSPETASRETEAGPEEAGEPAVQVKGQLLMPLEFQMPREHPLREKVQGMFDRLSLAAGAERAGSGKGRGEDLDAYSLLWLTAGMVALCVVTAAIAWYVVASVR